MCALWRFVFGHSDAGARRPIETGYMRSSVGSTSSQTRHTLRSYEHALNPVLATALMLFVSAPAFAQEPTEFVSKTDYFSISFMGQPTVREITYPSEYRITLPARVYSSDARRNHYAVTVIDYRDAIKIHAARNDKCIADAGADRPGLTATQRRDLVGDACQDDGAKDVRGAMMWAT